MSAVERALRKLQTGKAGAATAGTSGPVARPVHPQQDTEHPSGGRELVIDFDALRESGLFSQDDSKLADEYRAIKRPLFENLRAGGDRANLVMVASAISGEGKTFTSINLAMSFAKEHDWSALLVDADCKKPQLTRLFGAENEPGLMDALRDGSSSIESLIMRTNVKGLEVLPIGKTDDHAAELLGSTRMTDLCDFLARGDARRIVLFDSSPVLLTAEAPILAGHVGQVVMVVRANQTPRSAVIQAVEKLDKTRAIGMLLNQVDDSSSFTGYGYGYGYGYGGTETRQQDLSLDTN